MPASGGSGAAGAILAYEMAARGKSVIVLDRGKHVDPSDFTDNEPGTLRVTLAARGKKLLGAAAAAVEAVVFAVVFSSLAASLDAPARLIGYAIGVAAGTLVGLFIDERASRGTSEVQVVAT